MSGPSRRPADMPLALLVCAALIEPGPGASPAAGARTLPIDPKASSVEFIVSRPGETVQGIAPGPGGVVVFDPASPAAGPSVVVRFEAAALRSGNRMRDRRMRTAHLETLRFPGIEFRSTSIRVSPGPADGPGGPVGALRPGESRRALVEGDLDLHGVVRRILFPATIRYDDGALEAEGEVSFRLSDHDIPIPRFLWLVLDDSVTVRFRLVARPARGEPPEGTTAPAPPGRGSGEPQG